MNTTRHFSADSNKLAYAQAFTRTSVQHPVRVARDSRRLSLPLRRTRKHSV